MKSWNEILAERSMSTDPYATDIEARWRETEIEETLALLLENERARRKMHPYAKPYFLNAGLWQHVYVMRNSGNDLLKIGISKNPRKRAQDLNMGAAAVACCWASPKPYPFAKIIEAEAHEILFRWHVRGEWFNCSIDIALAAIDRAEGVWRRKVSRGHPPRESAALAARLRRNFARGATSG